MADQILLENGSTFPGEWKVCRDRLIVGEAVFNTGMTGYQEILTDPSYAGQVVAMTYTEVGNYGVSRHDMESGVIHVAGFVVRELSSIDSNFESEGSLASWLETCGVPCMAEIDTRALTRVLRNEGAMRCTFMLDGEGRDSAMARIRQFNYSGVDFTAQVSRMKKHLVPPSKAGRSLPRVAVVDFGVKANILRILAEFAEVEVYTVSELQALASRDRFHGYFLSNGPGDPAAVRDAIALVRSFLDEKKPLFGICMGHQILSLALGGKTFKLKFGHHGINHPVKNLLTGKVEISSQNHGYAVDPESFPRQDVMPTHVNLNDNSLAGLMLKDAPVYSIQYHPEAAPGPHDSRYLFDRFREDLLRCHAGAG